MYVQCTHMEAHAYKKKKNYNSPMQQLQRWFANFSKCADENPKTTVYEERNITKNADDKIHIYGRRG